jgi:hypothetical protein
MPANRSSRLRPRLAIRHRSFAAALRKLTGEHERLAERNR